MNGSTDNRASSPQEKVSQRDLVLSLATARRMLPLVQLIVADLQNAHQQLAKLGPEQDRLERRRRILAWPERQRRYQIGEEIARQEQQWQGAQVELDGLGVALLDPSDGWVGFPTIVNKRRAFFVWKPEQEGLRHWQFAGESVVRTIPVSWAEEAESDLSRKR